MFEIIISNFGFWVNLLIPIMIGVYLFFRKHNREFTIQELGAQCGFTVVFVGALYLIIFNTTTDLQDKQYINSQLKMVQYHQGWTELVTYTESYPCGKSTCTRTRVKHEYHPEYWNIIATNGHYNTISKDAFDNYSKHTATMSVYRPYRSDQVSIGDGYITDITLNKDFLITYDESYINYVVAANLNILNSKVDDILITQGVKDGSLLPYPNIIYSNYEYILPRVLTTIPLDTTIKQQLEQQLYNMNTKYSEAKQCNILLYITNKDRDFVDLLKYYWKNGKKNDIVLIVSLNENKDINWTDVITYTDNTNFIVDVQNIKGNVNNVISTFEPFISEYKRKSMKDFKYLAENIELDFKWNLLIIILNIIGNALIFRYFHNNTDRR